MRTRKSTSIAMALVVLAFFSNPATGAETGRVLMVGNSILYTNNVPAVLMEIARANGRTLKVDMYAQGGAQIVDLIDKPQVLDALRNNDYDAVIFHDRGGDAICAASEESRRTIKCRRMIEDHRFMVRLIEESGATPYLLGTYQPKHASERLLQGERHVSKAASVELIEIGSKLHRLREAIPDAGWFAEDGMHPGMMLTVLMATEVYRALFSRYPEAAGLATSRPLHVPRQWLAGIVPHDITANDGMNKQHILSETEFAALLRILADN